MGRFGRRQSEGDSSVLARQGGLVKSSVVDVGADDGLQGVSHRFFQVGSKRFSKRFSQRSGADADVVVEA